MSEILENIGIALFINLAVGAAPPTLRFFITTGIHSKADGAGPGTSGMNDMTIKCAEVGMFHVRAVTSVVDPDLDFFERI
jgi:hypothetical protein